NIATRAQPNYCSMKVWLPVLFLTFIIAAISTSCQSDQDIEFKRYYSSGRAVYLSHCQNCHGANGEGLGTLMPPLNDTAYLKKNKGNLACMVNNGIQQPLLVKQKLYYQKMPPSGLAPIDIAEVLTYITNSFGNKLGTYTVGQANKDLAACH